MEANELMIGDIVKTNSSLWNDEDLKDKYCKVEFIGGDNLRCVLLDNPEIHPYGSEKAFDPIPLTPEILEKNGFNDDGEGVYGDDNSYFVPIYQSEHNDSYFIPTCTCGHIEAWETHIEPTEGIGDFSGKLRYVHELQHALKLCGIEKEIKF